MVVAIARWLVNPGEEVWLVYRRVQVVWLSALTGWSLFVRIALRRGLLLPDAPRLLLLASDVELPRILQAWARVSLPQRLEPISPFAFDKLITDGSEPLLVAISSGSRHDPSLRLLEHLERQDPRLVQVISLISLFEKQQERLPVLLADSVCPMTICPGLTPSAFRLSSSAWPICCWLQFSFYLHLRLLFWRFVDLA